MDQWCTGSGFWSPIRPDIGNLLDLDWISFSLQPDPDYPNEINCDHRKNLKWFKWINSFMKKKYTISKWYWWKFIFLYSLGSMQYSLPLGILTFRLGQRTSQLSSNMHCNLELCEDEYDSIVLLWRSPSLFRRMLFHWNAFASRSQ